MVTAKDIQKALEAHADAEDAVFLQRFFKTNEGQYGASDVFIGIRVPETRKVCAIFKDVSLGEVKKLLGSPIHECRLAAVILLTDKYKKADLREREQIFQFYLEALDEGRINNWDIVDSSAEFIVGEHLLSRPKELLFTLAKSDDVWHRRVAVLASFQFIKNGDPKVTLELAEMLLGDTHDLIQKAVGWMLREVGKRIDRRPLLSFLDKHAKIMPRTMLRYAIEHLPPDQRKKYMQK
jgi:3-methyladenine DNA glycosylase AlkD